MIFKKDKTYDILKTIALLLPILTGLYKAIGEIWGIPYTSEIVYTLIAINSALGALIVKANSDYNKTELINQYDQEEENGTEMETNEIGDEDV